MRGSVHAGSWYECEQVEGLMRSTAVEVEVEGIGVIAPHAGLRYSGSTAACAYGALAGAREVHTVFVLGPAHRLGKTTCMLTRAHTLHNPIRSIPVDTLIIQTLLQQYPTLFDTISLELDQQEHSVELQLPFIAHLVKQ
jgi:AmmeMemoRadiSam system protein B